MNKNVPTPTEIPKPPKFKVKSGFVPRKKHLRKQIARLEKENKELENKYLISTLLFVIAFIAFIVMCFFKFQVK